MITHEYNYEDASPEPHKVDHRRWVTKRTQDQIPMSKMSGRKDNSNKEPNTYFDKHDIIKLLTRNNSSLLSADSLEHFRQNNEAQDKRIQAKVNRII